MDKLQTPNKYTVIRQQATENFSKILDSFKIEYRESYGYFHCCCPIHQGDNKNAFSWSRKLGIWKCWSHGCDGEYNGMTGKDAIAFIRKYKACSIEEAIYVAEKILDGVPISETTNTPENKFFNLFDKKEKIKYKAPKVVLHPYLIKRGISTECAIEYQISFWDKSALKDRIVIPIIDINGDIIGFTGRAVTDRNSKKWLHSAGTEVGKELFNILNIKNSNEVILTEGPFDVMRLWMCGIKNSAATFGTNLSFAQLSLLLRLPIHTVILAYDGDKAGEKANLKIGKILKDYFEVYIVDIENGKDIGDLDEQQIRAVLASKRRI